MGQDRDEEIRSLRERLAALEAEKAAELNIAGSDRGQFEATNWRSGGILMLALFGVVLLLVAIAQCSEPDLEPPANTEDRAVAERDVAPPPPLPPPADWSYRDSRDPMTDGLTRFACTTSKNRAQLTWPYSSVTADLCIRQSPRYGLDVIVSLNGDGQIICQSYRNCTVKVRFGEGAAQSFSAADAADGSSNVVFITNAQRFVAAAKKADTIKVQLTFYQAGDQVLEFDTENLEWPRPAPDN